MHTLCNKYYDKQLQSNNQIPGSRRLLANIHMTKFIYELVRAIAGHFQDTDDMSVIRSPNCFSHFGDASSQG